MTRLAYKVKETYTGTGTKLDYTFDFKIEANTQLLVIELDDTGVELQRVLGDDATFLDSVVFDSLDGGGTVNLLANLPVNYKLIILLANDLPTQDYRFRNKESLTMRRFEAALDFVVGAVQRLSYRGKQALRINDTEDEETFNAQFPGNIAVDGAARYLRVNDAGDGFQFGVTEAELIGLVLPDGTVARQVFEWDGASWAPALSGSGMMVSALQSIAANGQITQNTARQQLLKVEGNGAAQSANLAPFSVPPLDGTIITLQGKSDARPLKISYSDTDEGCMIKGDAYLGLNDTLTLVYDLADRRYYDLSRN